MIDLNYYNREKSKVIENVNNYIIRLKKGKEILSSVNLPINFDEFTEKLDGIVKSLIDDKVRVSVIAEVSNGKSTFLNALIFKNIILDARIGETTARLYHISYGDEYAVKYKNLEKKFNSLEEIKEFIKQLNKETLEKAEESREGGKVLNISEDELSVFIYIPLEHLRVGIEVIDTPGFGTLNEELMMKFITSAIHSSDAVITILDISQGIKKSESEKFSKLLSMIRPDKRYIVFNKVDSYEDEVENFDYVSRDVINNMNRILEKQGYDQKIDVNQLFYVSAKLALQGFIKQAKAETLDEGAKKYKELFEEFEKEFWNDVINYKQKEFLSDKISSFERLKDSINKEINSIYKNLKNRLLQIKAEKDKILRSQYEISSMSSKLQGKANNCINYLKSIKLSADEVISDIEEEILQKSKVIDYIEENYGFLSSLTKKGEIEEEIKCRLKNVDIKSILKSNLKKYYGDIFERIRFHVQDYNESAYEFNSKLEKMGIEKFRFPVVEYKESEEGQEKQISTQFEIKRSGVLAPALGGYLTGALIGGLIEQLVLGTVIGAAGFVAVSILIPIFISKDVKKKKEELKQKIREGVRNSLYDIKVEINKLNNTLEDYIDDIRRKVIEVEFINSEIIKALEKSDLDEEIKKIENQLDTLKNIANVLEIKILAEV
ncbi:dynamin family protein [Sulfurihydrogenibium subterraneum]|uniref:dynamin family protein n=1 Tax=Sulfurihydrogenibium subterraneum TaxID=171121 RepID=UPI00048FEC10|nr:dynamin family protein [Sulfurihydrogenibium subterraneum]